MQTPASSGDSQQNADALARATERARLFPSYQLLGWQVDEVDVARSAVAGRFAGKPDFAHAGGMVSGGFVAAMLDSVLSQALGVSAADDEAFVTTSLNVNFIGAAAPGPIAARASVVRRGRVIAFTEGALLDAEGALVATATATCRFVQIASAPARG